MVKSCRAMASWGNHYIRTRQMSLLDVKMEVLRDYQHLPCVKEAIKKADVSSELGVVETSFFENKARRGEKWEARRNLRQEMGKKKCLGEGLVRADNHELGKGIIAKVLELLGNQVVHFSKG